MQSTKVLIVEDEVIVGMDIQCRLNKIGYTAVGPVVTGEDAVARAEREVADLVLMDINLPGDIDGITAARRIHDRLDIPVVFLTAYSDEGTLQQAKHAEPAGYLVKPFNER
ncbi:MAG TPA: response regulator, partial [Blastocatellia bacterium]|nr:response regulator [Blastocatellia bacterium]